MRRALGMLSLAVTLITAAHICGCRSPAKPHIIIGSKFFTEQVVLAELLAQHIESHTGVHVDRKANLGGTLLCQKALESGELDLYVEYTGTALAAVLNQSPSSNSAEVYQRVKQGYSQRFNLEVTEPLGYENTFAMVIRDDDAQKLNLHKTSDLAAVAPRWRVGVGYEFLERPDGFLGWSNRYDLHFAAQPAVMDLGLIYRALVDRKVDVVAGNSTDGLIDALHLVPLIDDRHYFPPYDVVPIVRRDTLARFPQLRASLAALGGRISAEEMRRLNAEIDANQRDVTAVVRTFREAKSL